jgi:hypothetical protein
MRASGSFIPWCPCWGCRRSTGRRLSVLAGTVTMPGDRVAADFMMRAANLAGSAIPFAAALTIARHVFHRDLDEGALRAPGTMFRAVPAIGLPFPSAIFLHPVSNADRCDRGPIRNLRLGLVLQLSVLRGQHDFRGPADDMFLATRRSIRNEHAPATDHGQRF